MRRSLYFALNVKSDLTRFILLTEIFPSETVVKLYLTCAHQVFLLSVWKLASFTISSPVTINHELFELPLLVESECKWLVVLTDAP